jgi:ADP-heptose:LPS heptosyltransferase
VPLLKVLVYHIGQLGDTIVSIPALRAVRHYFGQHSRIYMLHDASQRLVAADAVLEGSGLVDEFIPYSPAKRFRNKLRTFLTLWRRLRRERFDAVVSLLPSDRSRRALLRDRTFFRACGIPRLIGFRPFRGAEIRPRHLSGRPVRTPHEAVFRLRRLFAEGIANAGENLFALPLLILRREKEAAIDHWLERRRRDPKLPLVALCPGCKKPANSWPAERFVEIARRLVDLSRVELIILGGPAERELADSIVSALDGRAIHAAGCFSVMQSAALLSRCSLLVGLDTGTTHLAAAVGVKCVVIQSANSFPGQWDPLGDGHSVIRVETACEGCLLQECPVAGHPCMQNISVDRVWQAIETAISTSQYEHHASHSHL